MKAKYNVEHLKVPHEYITLFASGISMLKLTREDTDVLCRHTFVVSTNFPFSLHIPEFVPHLHVWSDEGTSFFTEEYYKDRPKNCLWMSRPDAFTDGKKMKESLTIYPQVDFWFDREIYKLKSNFTFYWALQLLKRVAPDKPILTFGLDGFIPQDSPCDKGLPYSKWYDFYTDADRKERTYEHNITTLSKSVDDLEEDYKENPGYFADVFNCNLESHVKYLTKKDYREVLKI